MYNNEQLLSKEDFLALSEDYQKEKAAIKKKYKKQQFIGGAIFVFGMILTFIMIPIAFDSGISMLSVIFIGAIVWGTGIVVLATGSSKSQKVPEEIGVKYYQRYVAEYNAHHND